MNGSKRVRWVSDCLGALPRVPLPLMLTPSTLRLISSESYLSFVILGGKTLGTVFCESSFSPVCVSEILGSPILAVSTPGRSVKCMMS